MVAVQPSLLVAPRAMTGTVLDDFHPAVAAWFQERFADGPTEPQREAWPHIRSGADVLVAAPTGTGKTLTGFLVALDAAYREADEGVEATPGVRVLYLSPLRALASDIEENLERPLAGIAEKARQAGAAVPEITTAVRTGDTAASARAAMARKPPRILCTTPESLYLLLTSASGRSMLSSVRTVIVDEIHAMARDKRGSHLAVSLERLDRLVEVSGGLLQRIGLSATQRPLEVVARLLGGVREGRAKPVILDCVRHRRLDVALELPDDELDAVASRAQFDQVLDAIAAQVMAHQTTLVFVNTRRLAERVAHLLAERLGGERYGLDEADQLVASHHGSLSAERRRRVEDRLRAGDLRALVATASLELGLDVGPVEMVCQLGSPRAIATFLQRVGRANHSVAGIPSGRLYPMTRDELVECTALLDAVALGELDVLEPPIAPIDIAVQQVVAEVAAREEVALDDLFDLLVSAAPFAELTRESFDEIIELASRGILTGRGRRGAHLHLDAINGRVRARAGARLAALTSGGAIPETGDYRVVLDPDGVTLGAVHEDFAIESSAGDIFLLGTHSWRVTKVETGTVRVVDAAGAPPTVPFWLGEAPARTRELSAAVGRLRARVEACLVGAEPATGRAAAARELSAIPGVGTEAAVQIAAYLAASREALGALPTCEHLVIERFFDDVDSTQLVVHSPFGGRINRALGLGLRKRFCVTFDFELQAAADDDTVTIALGPHHSFPLDAVPSMVTADSLEAVVTQAVLLHPMLAARWRWNLGRALIVPRAMGSKRRPIHLQRMEAEDLLAAAWPSLAACQENAAPGPIPIPDHVLVRQTIRDVLSEPLDLDGARDVLARLASGEITVSFVESAEPSPLALGILNGRPYTFLDDAPLEERRSRAVPQRRGMPGVRPDGTFDLAGSVIDPDALLEVLETTAARPRSADELHDVILDALAIREVPAWERFAAQLVAEGRLVVDEGLWIAAEQLEAFAGIGDDDLAAADCLRVHLGCAGPVTMAELLADHELGRSELRGAPLSPARAETAIRRLEGMGLAIELPDGRWCARHLLARLHAATRATRARRIEAVPISTYLALLGRHSHVAPTSRLTGRAGLLAVIDQLAGIEAPIGEWEASILPSRIASYDPAWLDELCLTGEVMWGRLSPKRLGEDATTARRVTPSRSTPITFFLRVDADLWLDAVRLGQATPRPAVGPAAEIAALLEARGACFRSELPGLLDRLPAEIDEGLFDLLARGLVTADGFGAARSLLSPAQRFARRQRAHGRPGGPGARPVRSPLSVGEGRWSLLELGEATELSPARRDEVAEHVAMALARRWGVVAWELTARESFRLPWREIRWALRRLEARGELLGGRFIAGLSGEQFALPHVAPELARAVADHEPPVALAASDPLNLSGSLVPGERIPAMRRRRVAYGAGTVTELPAG
jgi:ATP-dependent Lhr-like helicase